MEFKESFREQYRIALLAARENNTEGVVEGLTSLYHLFAEQYETRNGDSIVIKAKLSHWRDIFGGYVQIVRKFGLQDRRVQKLFGLIDDPFIPSFADILKGKDSAIISSDGNTSPLSPESGDHDGGGINCEGIFPPNIEVKSAEPEIPVAPTEPDELIIPIAPVEPVTPIDTLPVIPADSELLIPDREDEEPIPVYTPASLKSFIGQQHIVKALLKEIAIAKKEGRKHLDNILLFGNSGLGKTTLMELIAKELGVKFELLDCSQFRNSQQSLKAIQNFFMRVARDNQPVVIAFDEIHMLNNELQSSLLTLLNNRVYVSPLDVNGQCKRIPIDEFTFIAATTDDNKVLDTIKNRCLRLTFQLVDYTPEELDRIYKSKVAAKGLTITDEAVDTCIPRSRGAIRYVNSIVDGLNNALYNDEGVRISTHIGLETALNYFKEKGIDEIGLEKKDLEILKVLEEDTSGAVSLDTLSARVGLDPKKYQSEHERYLMKIGFLSVSGKGRRLTEKAVKYLNNKRLKE